MILDGINCKSVTLLLVNFIVFCGGMKFIPPQPPFLLCQNSRISSIKITVVVCQIYNKFCLIHSVVIESAFSGKTELSTNFDILFSKDSDPKKNKIENFYEKSKQSYVFSLEYGYFIAQKIFDCILLNFYYLFFI